MEIAPVPRHDSSTYVLHQVIVHAAIVQTQLPHGEVADESRAH